MAAGFFAISMTWPVTEYGLTFLPLIAIYALLLILAFIDLDTFTLPDALTLPGLLLALAGTLLYAADSGLPSFSEALTGAMIAAGALTLVNRLGGLAMRRFRDTKERLWPIGFDQVNLAAVAGLAGRRTWTASAVGNLAIAGLWVWSRTAGLPIGEHEGIVEEVGAIDLMAQALGVGAAVISARLALAPEGSVSRSRLAPAFAAAAAIGLATTVITSPDASSHGTVDEEPALSGHEATMARIDETRCDTDFNHPSYWEEAQVLGIDTYEGGALLLDDLDGEREFRPAAGSAEVSTAINGGAVSNRLSIPRRKRAFRLIVYEADRLNRS